MSDEHQRQCWGRVGRFLLRRCQRRGHWWLFCDDHKDHWLLIILAAYTGQSLVAEAMDWSDRLRGPSQAEVALQRGVYTEISLSCHSWKNMYMALHPSAWPVSPEPTSQSYIDAWDRLEAVSKPQYGLENWVRFRPLFEQGIDDLRERLQDASASYADVLSPELRNLIREVHLQLSVEQLTYRETNPRNPPVPELANEGMFHGRFDGVLRECAQLDREVQRLRDDSAKSQTRPQ